MRKYLFFSIICAFLFTVMSCEKDACAKVSCGDYGTCENGDCNCLIGYEKDGAGKCTVESRLKFFGKWEGNLTVYRDSSGVSIDTSVVSVALNARASQNSINEIDILDFNSIACMDSIKATVKANSIISVKPDFCSSPGWQIGTSFSNLNWYVNGGEMNIDIMVTITDPNRPIGGVSRDHYIGTLMKK